LLGVALAGRVPAVSQNQLIGVLVGAASLPLLGSFS
jgi:hypothetical protein